MELAASRRADRPRTHDGSSDVEAQILAATERLLAATPVHKLSVARIIAAAGVSRATFYFYFSSKFAVIAALLARVMDEIFVRVTPYIERDDAVAPDTALRQSLDASAELWREHRPVMRAAIEHWHTVPAIGAIWTGVVERFAAAIAAEIDRERAAGIAPPGPPSRQLAKLLLWSSERALYVSGLDSEPDLAGERETAELLLGMWVGTIYGPAVTPRPH